MPDIAGRIETQPTGSHYVDGQYLDGEGPEFESVHPADRTVIARLRAADQGVIEQAIDSADEGAGRLGGDPAG